MQAMGFDAQLRLSQAGFYPQGGGRIDVSIRPASQILPLRLESRRELLSIKGISAVANLDLSIAERQKRQALRRLSPICPNTRIKIIQLPSPGKGTLLLLLARFKPESGASLETHPQACYYALGERQKPAERVADEAVDALLEFLATDAVIDQYLADQILLPLSFASGASRLRTSRVTQHLLTNAEIIRLFTSARIDITGDLGQPGWIEITPSSPPPPSSRLVG